MMYKYANNLLPPVINDMYTTNSDVHNYSTRQKHLLHVNKNSKCLQKCICKNIHFIPNIQNRTLI